MDLHGKADLHIYSLASQQTSRNEEFSWPCDNTSITPEINLFAPQGNLLLYSRMHLKTDPVLVLFPHWQVKEDEMGQYGSSACSFPSLLASHSTHSKPFLGSIHAFDNIFLQAISLYVNTFHFNVRFEPWQLGEAEVPPTGTVPCEQKLEILTRVQPSLKCCSLAVCAVLPPVYFPAQSCHCFCRLRAMCHM